MESQRPKVGICRCLLGEPCRYDGKSKNDPMVSDALSRLVEWVAVCPETECGLPVPREPMDLVGDPDSPRLLGKTTRTDHTDRLTSWTDRRLGQLSRQGINGFVFKARSPSCALRDASIYNSSGRLLASGPGLFTRALAARFPQMPVADEQNLHDTCGLEEFVGRLKSS